ncbi:DNA-binding transcriptional regulator, MarR family [Agromyces sp. CF514]|uniref:MarR family winged helix-turn-helix transcriptional regulator n=1 Tax=Agromyces sp. CF514 TaxID=1881031 RepID=UPI0008E379FB|nr:winged helix DNA-binding protein [Agromyces sp. CF514]SFR77824.1 DNA-binding transcriptional regulator, MarR family [Agromyces sp. CF514]
MSEDRAQISIEVGVLLNQVHSAATERLNTALQPMNLNSRHAAVMFLIRDGVETQRDLVARLNTDKTGMVRMVDDLDRLGYVSRTPSTSDRRVTILRLTAAGEDALREAQLHTRRVADDVFHAVDSEDLVALRSILSRVLGSHASTGNAG